MNLIHFHLEWENHTGAERGLNGMEQNSARFVKLNAEEIVKIQSHPCLVDIKKAHYIGIRLRKLIILALG
jgi:hypothetical protein